MQKYLTAIYLGFAHSCACFVSFHLRLFYYFFFFFFISFYCMHGKLLPLQAELGPRAAGTHKRIYHDHSREPAQHMATISNADDQVKQKNEGKKTPAERAFRGSSKSKSTEPETETESETELSKVKVIDREGEGSICCCC